MTEPTIVDRLTAIQVLALTLWGEARSESLEGRVAVASVVRNRVRGREGRDYRGVCLAPFQFSCWGRRGGEQNHAAVLDQAHRLADGGLPPPLVRECLWIAEGVISGDLLDASAGADHYLTRALYDSPAAPSWAKRFRVTACIGRHVFLASDGRPEREPVGAPVRPAAGGTD